jgi:hypothetical protein
MLMPEASSPTDTTAPTADTPSDSAAPAPAGTAAPAASAAPAAAPPPIRPAAPSSAAGPASASAAEAPASGEPAPEAPAKAEKAADAGSEVLSKTTDITAGPGGVMTREVGVITGDLTLRSELADGKITLRVQYKDADEWYVVTGGKAALKDPADLEAVHKIAVGLLNRPEG